MLKKANFDYVVQDLIPTRSEGIFYVRYPHEKKVGDRNVSKKISIITETDSLPLKN
jgi:hypothetical protein